MFSYEQFHWPEFRLRKWTKGKAKLAIDKLVCSPFTRPENGFCVKSDVCSCEEVSPQVYRVKTVYTIENVDESRGKLSLIWPSRISNITKHFHLPKVKAPKPNLEIVRNVSSFNCSDEYLVVGKDFITFEVDVSGNNSDYSLKKYSWPVFYREIVNWKNEIATIKDFKPICAPFTTPGNGFCVKRDDGCSCEEIRPQVYRVSVTYTVESIVESQGRLSLIWLSKNHYMEAYANIPAIKDFCIESSLPKNSSHRKRSNRV
ncbi:hypothetical protein PoB_006619400 [Plakobranchus ocellatus]|uniref:Phlebovirus glycoprotein G2 fusion domain-containing protein n=1 Tax=Plakobranchus ocellatus TaxID=259542 RepID=A0AAV4D6A0_9GAST|nr:hypothetical protein PoB_006619400 [Plakobranchus ocellatus]